MHVSVLLNEALEYLSPRDGGTYIDCTFGAGGYSKAMLQNADINLYAIDLDPDAQEYFNKIKTEVKNAKNLHFINGNFADMEDLLARESITKVDGIVMDLGVSSMQIDRAERGFSFNKESKLDMRMNKSGYSAYEFINNASEAEIARVIREYGEEKSYRRIAKNIVSMRAKAPIETTTQLSEIVHSALGSRIKKGKIDLATKTFQAIRILINDELNNLSRGLIAAEKLLKKGGRIVVVSFHSLEDSIVKKFIQERSQKAEGYSRYMPSNNQDDNFYATFKNLTKKAVKPSDAELRSNVRARSARLRAAEKIMECEVEYA